MKTDRRTFLQAVGALRVLSTSGEKIPVTQIKLGENYHTEAVDSLDTLKDHIEAHGVLNSLIVENGVIVAGVRRVVACLELEKEGRLKSTQIPTVFYRADGPTVNGFIDLKNLDPDSIPLPREEKVPF